MSEELKQREFLYRYKLQKRLDLLEEKRNDPVTEPFYFTDYTELKGCGCKIPRDKLNEFLKVTNYDASRGAKVGRDGSVGVGLDSAIIPLKGLPDVSMVQSTDFFYPLIDDPYLMGLVTVANVLSDLYATGVTDIDNMLMLLGVSTDLKGELRFRIVSEFMNGFQAGAKFAQVELRGGQTVECPWMLLGGVGTAIVPNTHLSRLDGAVPGDVLVVTKPLGVRAAVNAHQWIHKCPDRLRYQQLSESKIRIAYRQACLQMASHNLVAAALLKEYHAHASTDITGFGILGHADNLAKAQRAKCRFRIEKMPMIPYTDVICKSFPNENGFNMFDGLAAETSGGLLVAMKRTDADAYVDRLNEEFGIIAHVIGEVVAPASDKAPNDAFITDHPVIVLEEAFVAVVEKKEEPEAEEEGSDEESDVDQKQDSEETEPVKPDA